MYEWNTLVDAATMRGTMGHHAIEAKLVTRKQVYNVFLLPVVRKAELK